jgi:hypothetical protein
MKSRARIKSPNPRGSITMKEVAAEASLSTAMVSRVLASPIGVAANYEVIRSGRSGRGGIRRHAVGDLVASAADQFGRPRDPSPRKISDLFHPTQAQACSKHMTICKVEQQITTNESAPINK